MTPSEGTDYIVTSINREVITLMTRQRWITLRDMYVSRRELIAQKKTPIIASVRDLGRGPTANISRKLPHWGKSY